VDDDAEAGQDRAEGVVLALRLGQVDRVQEAVSGVLVGAAERGAGALHEGLAERRGHALGAEAARAGCGDVCHAASVDDPASRLPAVSEEHDYRAEYNEAVRRAIAGEVGVYRDFDRHRQETVWRLLSSDRQALLRFCQRQGISVGKMETMQTLKSPKPLLQLIAHGHDADTVARWIRRG
jgi:hypothetical protein